MAGVDSSIYLQMQAPDILGNVARGLGMRQQIQQGQRAAQEQEWTNQAQKAYGLGVVQNPDGTTSYDYERVRQGLAPLAGSNPTAAKMLVDIENNIYSRGQDATKLKMLQESHATDERYKNAQIGKLNAEAKQILTKPNEPPEIKTNQATAAGFGRRLEQAENVFDNLSGNGYDRAGFVESLGSSMPNFAKGAAAQRQDQAERNFVNAVLRRESGAAISPTEFESAELQYFPRFGDSADVIAQKKANREQARIALQAEAGKAWNRIPLAGSSELTQSPGSPTGSFPRQITKGTQTATVANAAELKEARSEGWK